MQRLSYRDIWGQSAFALACSIIANGCILASAMLVARHFGTAPEQADRYFYLIAVLVFGALLINQGVPSATAKELAGASGQDRPRVLAVSLELNLLYTLLTLLAAVAFAVSAWDRARLPGELPWLLLCLAVFGPAKWIAGALQGFGKLKTAAACETSLEVFRLASLAVVLAMSGDAADILRGWALAGACHLLLGIVLLTRVCFGAGCRIAFMAGRGHRAFASLASLFFLPFAGLFAANQYLNILLGELGAPGDVSRWAVSLQLAGPLLLLAGPLGVVLLPHLSRGASAAPPDPKALAAALRPVLLPMGAVLALGAAALAVLAAPLGHLLFTEAFASRPDVARLLCVLFALEAPKFVLEPALIILGRGKALAKVEAARLALVLVLGPWAVARWSVDGALVTLGAAIVAANAGKWMLYLAAARPGVGLGGHAVR